MTVLNKKEAEEWARNLAQNGTYPLRDEYRECVDISEIAKKCWDDPMFTYGLEYGILIAVWAIYKGNK